MFNDLKKKLALLDESISSDINNDGIGDTIEDMKDSFSGNEVEDEDFDFGEVSDEFDGLEESILLDLYTLDK